MAPKKQKEEPVKRKGILSDHVRLFQNPTPEWEDIVSHRQMLTQARKLGKVTKRKKHHVDNFKRYTRTRIVKTLKNEPASKILTVLYEPQASRSNIHIDTGDFSSLLSKIHKYPNTLRCRTTVYDSVTSDSDKDKSEYDDESEEEHLTIAEKNKLFRFFESDAKKVLLYELLLWIQYGTPIHARRKALLSQMLKSNDSGEEDTE